MQQPTITFIGAGNMASALIGGLIADNYPAAKIWATDPNPEKLEQLHKRFGIHTTTNNEQGVAQSEVLVLAVKPQILKSVVTALSASIQRKAPLLISIAGMISTVHLENWLGAKLPIIRCMPNTPALIRCGATGLFANPYATPVQKNRAESIMRAVGLVVWINDETQMDTVTALSGCGPAYFFLFMQFLQEAAEKLGLNKETARLLTLQTALGAARLAMETPDDLLTLRKNVTSPGGSTEQAIKILENDELKQLFFQALQAAQQRAEEMIKMIESEK